MSEAMKLIVVSYVKLQDRGALESLLVARRKVLSDLQSVSGISTANAIEIIRGDLAIIDAGLEELKALPGTLPDNGSQ
ncbi:hypothetical protein [Bradyrhizobium sp. 195]|uniref:hypothetical protein n=1 Tax=Bradyrhizobium sp. 195 TaxID=2782662 RepID=UPI00200072F2|nr:hypothetical protein [Bradyrhizobium sp. 195]